MKLIQQKLAEMGFYDGEVDGLYGRKTEKALYEALGIHRNTPESHFKREEFRCTCRARYCNGFPAEPAPELFGALEEIRRDCGDKPLHITSGVRCEKRNAEVGGVANSWHKFGRAADFYIPGVPAKTIVQKINGRYLETYAIDNNAVHIAVRKEV